jgi:hypothetical protein
VWRFDLRTKKALIEPSGATDPRAFCMTPDHQRRLLPSSRLHSFEDATLVRTDDDTGFQS